MRKVDRYLIAIVVAHFGITVLHAGAHFALQILPTGLDLAFILAVILIGPIVGLVLLRLSRALAGGLLAVLFGASFVYGFVSHFVIAGSDNVALAASQPWTVVFVVTAAAIGALEIVGAALAAAVLLTAARTPSEPAGPPG